MSCGEGIQYNLMLLEAKEELNPPPTPSRGFVPYVVASNGRLTVAEAQGRPELPALQPDGVSPARDDDRNTFLRELLAEARCHALQSSLEPH